MLGGKRNKKLVLALVYKGSCPTKQKLAFENSSQTTLPTTPPPIPFIINGILNKLLEILKYMEANKISIAALQEIKINSFTRDTP